MEWFKAGDTRREEVLKYGHYSFRKLYGTNLLFYLSCSAFKGQIGMAFDFIDILWVQNDQWANTPHKLEDTFALFSISNLVKQDIDSRIFPTFANPSAINSRAD